MSPQSSNTTRTSLGMIAICMALEAPLANADPGSIGFSLAVSVEGIFSPKVSRAEIKKVDAGSPAEAAGLRPGDLITQIDDCKVPGCPGGKAKALLAKEAGQVLKLRVLRDGKEQDFTVHVAAKAQ